MFQKEVGRAGIYLNLSKMKQGEVGSVLTPVTWRRALLFTMSPTLVLLLR